MRVLVEAALLLVAVGVATVCSRLVGSFALVVGVLAAAWTGLRFSIGLLPFYYVLVCRESNFVF